MTTSTTTTFESITREHALVLYVLSYFKDQKGKQFLTELELYKFLYFLETRYFLEFRKRATDFPFFRNHLGPAIRSSISIQSSFFKKTVWDKSQKERTKYELTSEKFILPFDQAELNLFKDVMDKYGNLSSYELVNLSHQESPYHIASKQGDIDVSNIIYQNFDLPEDCNETISISPNLAGFLRSKFVTG